MKKLANLSLALGSVLTVTTIGTFALPSGEAQALTLEGSIGFTGLTEFTPDIHGDLAQDYNLHFQTAEVNSLTGDFATSAVPDIELSGSNPTVQDINLEFLSTNGGIYSYKANAVVDPNSPSPFIDFGNTTIQGERGDLSFVIDPNDFPFVLTNLGFDNVTGGSNVMHGNFEFNGSTAGNGTVTVNASGNSQNYSFTLHTAHQTPEPSALVGLVGVLGLGALIKKGKKSA